MPNVDQRAGMRTHAKRLGFTFVELLVGLAIMVMIAAVVTPVMIGTLDQARIESTLESFVGISIAIATFENDVTDYPSNLSQLVTEITTGQPDICGVNYSGANVGDWNGPYLTYNIPVTGLPTPIGQMRNTISRSPVVTNFDWVVMVVDSVAIEDALKLNVEVEAGDGDDDPAAAGVANSVIWSVPSNGVVTLSLRMPAGTC